jgi:hypothetical protein
MRPSCLRTYRVRWSGQGVHLWALPVLDAPDVHLCNHSCHLLLVDLAVDLASRV